MRFVMCVSSGAFIVKTTSFWFFLLASELVNRAWSTTHRTRSRISSVDPRNRGIQSLVFCDARTTSGIMCWSDSDHYTTKHVVVDFKRRRAQRNVQRSVFGSVNCMSGIKEDHGV
ncbi:hypothetical protein BB8028_0001g12180 [Beauveria bassiana]|uniref:Uncharacterized protein n=1 Tax=Beauveria bassiana TaxID=176275 RepID=A0A2S7XZ16_BEABA|nr:hypothetical protein BB8028_0001g12180 [Beauveria bassiana]